jgi:hypothetical protein
MRSAAVLILAIALAACSPQGTTGNVDKFTNPDQRAVAQKVEDLESAGKRNKPDDICSSILSQELVSRLDAAGTSCQTEIKKAIEDANEYNLDTQKVTITGNTATAQVKRGKDGPIDTMKFTRENGQWRATSLSGG